MEIIPGIYLQHGQCVSWYKGHENEQKKVYPQTPLKMALFFQRAGAYKLSIINLDSNTEALTHNYETILQIAESTKLEIQIGGGLRSYADVEKYLNHGIQRVILGYSASHLIPKAIKQFGEDTIIAGIKAKKHLVESDSLLDTKLEIMDYAQELMQKGINQIIYKDLESEGTLHTHYDVVDQLLTKTKARIYLSGGISEHSQLQVMQKIGLHGAIISKAFFENQLSLEECLHIYSSNS